MGAAWTSRMWRHIRRSDRSATSRAYTRRAVGSARDQSGTRGRSWQQLPAAGRGAGQAQSDIGRSRWKFHPERHWGPGCNAGYAWCGLTWRRWNDVRSAFMREEGKGLSWYAMFCWNSIGSQAVMAVGCERSMSTNSWPFETISIDRMGSE